MYVRKDSYFKKAKAEGYRSRAAYKLAELNRTYHLFGRGFKVLDIGCAPGGFLQVAADAVGPKGLVVGIDLEETASLGLEYVKIVTGDACEKKNMDEILAMLGGRSDCLISDMAPDTSGVGFADAYRSAALVSTVLDIAGTHLKKGGSLVVKLFFGGEFESIRGRAKKMFGKVIVAKPDASRKTSREIYLVCLGFNN